MSHKLCLGTCYSPSLTCQYKRLGGLQVRFPSFNTRRTLHAILSHSPCPGETEAKGKRTTKDLVTKPVRPSVDVGDVYPFTSQIEKSAVGTK